MLGALLMTLLMGCSDRATNSDEPVHSVMVVTPENGDGEVQKTFSGIVEEGREIGVSFKTGGQLSRILVKEGDMVREGQLLAVLDDSDYQLGYDAARLQYEQMERELARLKKLYDAKSISGSEYDKAATGLEQLRVQLRSEENRLSYTKLYAPTSGYVQSVNFETAEMVGAGSAVVSLLDVKQLEITFNMPSSLYLKKDKFKGFTCQGAFSQGKMVPVKLISITPKADSNQLYKVRLALSPKEASNVTSGMNVEVHLDMEGEQSRGMTLPVSALVQMDAQSYVWLLDPATSTVSRRAVTTGDVVGDGRVIITSGLQGDEQVVRAGASVLLDNEKVRVIERNSETNVGGLL